MSDFWSQAWEMTDKMSDFERTSSEPSPVFRGLAAVGVTGREIASALRVSTASVSKWRNGRSDVPDDVLVFLTLMLGDQISRNSEHPMEFEQTQATDDDGSTLSAAEDELRSQERLNVRLPAMAIREGARRYRLWWNGMRNALLLRPDQVIHDMSVRYAASLR